MKKIVSLFIVFTLLITLYVPTANAATTTSVAPVIHLTFDDDLKDTSGNGYNGVAPDANITYETGKVGKAAKIDNAMITLTGSNKIRFTNAYSFAAWVRLDPDVASGDIISSKLVNESYNFFEVYSSYDDTNVGVLAPFKPADGGEYYNILTYDSDTFIEPAQNKDKFMHVAIVYDGKSTKIYLDGKLDSNVTLDKDYTTDMIFGSGEDFVVGGTGNDTFFHGYMDDLYLFDKAITFADITALYALGTKTASNKMIVTIEDPYMLVNGTKVEIDAGRGTKPIINAQGRTILPIRAVIEQMGGTVGWDGKTSMVTVTLNGKVIKLWINKDKAEANGVLKEIDPGKGVTPVIINGRTMLPIRFILQELGLPDLLWNGALRTITIQY